MKKTFLMKKEIIYKKDKDIFVEFLKKNRKSFKRKRNYGF
jgi:hypothetical protein